MFSHLVESAPPRRGLRGVPGTTLSLAFHALLAFGAIWATKSSGFAVVGPRKLIDVSYVPDPARPAPAPAPLPPVLGVLVLPDAPALVPVGIPPVDSALVVDTLTLLRSRVEMGTTLGPPPVSPDNGSVMSEAAVDERPEVISGFTPEYPDLLRQAGIEGTVVVELIVDTTGHAEAASVRVVRATNRAFEISAREAVMKTVYRAGRVRGQPVRVLVQVPITFSIRK